MLNMADLEDVLDTHLSWASTLAGNERLSVNYATEWEECGN